MGIARSTFYDDRTPAHDDTAIVEVMAAICDEFEFYGWRRVRAELRHRGMVVSRQRRCAEGGVGGVHRDAASGDAVSRPASRWNAGEAGCLADRCTRVWDLRDAALCEDDTPGPGGCSERGVGTLEQRADRRTDQQIEDPQASDVWPRRCRLAPRSDDAVAGRQLAPRVNQTPTMRKLSYKDQGSWNYSQWPWASSRLSLVGGAGNGVLPRSL